MRLHDAKRRWQDNVVRRVIEKAPERSQAFVTSSGIPLDAVVTHAEMMRAFEAFKETNDQRLALEQKRAGDGLRPSRSNHSTNSSRLKISASPCAQPSRARKLTIASGR